MNQSPEGRLKMTQDRVLGVLPSSPKLRQTQDWCPGLFSAVPPESVSWQSPKG